MSRLAPILKSLLVTVEMALLGTFIGVVLSLPVAVFAARNTTPHWSFYAVSRAVVTVSRTIPDLVWGLIFVIAVGLGPEAGVLAIAVDVMGFCGRFFAESIEDIEPGRIEGLRAVGRPVSGSWWAACSRHACPRSSRRRCSRWSLRHARRWCSDWWEQGHRHRAGHLDDSAAVRRGGHHHPVDPGGCCCIRTGFGCHSAARPGWSRGVDE